MWLKKEESLILTTSSVKLGKARGKKEVTIDYGDEATKLLQLVYAVNELDPDII